jgi:hypothetical protein
MRVSDLKSLNMFDQPILAARKRAHKRAEAVKSQAQSDADGER